MVPWDLHGHAEGRLHKLRVPELKDLCRERSIKPLPQKKDDLVNALLDWKKSANEAQSSASAESAPAAAGSPTRSETSSSSKLPYDLRNYGEARLSKLAEAELKALCKERGLKVSHPKKEEAVQELLNWKRSSASPSRDEGKVKSSEGSKSRAIAENKSDETGVGAVDVERGKTEAPTAGDVDSDADDEEGESLGQFRTIDDVPFMLNGLGRSRLEGFSTDFLRQLHTKRKEQTMKLNISPVAEGNSRYDYIEELMKWKDEIKRQYNLRANVDQKTEDVWSWRDNTDVYTLLGRKAVEDQIPEVDHVMEIQIINRAFGNADIKNNGATTRGVKNFLHSTVNHVHNLNVTPHKVNQAKKGPFMTSLNRILADAHPEPLRELAPKPLVDEGTWARIERAVSQFYDQLTTDISQHHQNRLTTGFQEELHGLLSKMGLEELD
eukprot:gb/GECG01000777.1/.p1 GENE.gb/GECG01000777.1/~~gb/GECG01000777.1/.p1  ORF type:complete len:438 (+),score=70.24 gb/GECG01000777.1/:1-1314(+)